MPRIALSVHARVLRAELVAAVGIVVTLAAATAAVAGGGPSTPPPPAPVHDGLAAQQELAIALAERQATLDVPASRAAAVARPTVVWPAAGAVTGVYGEPRRRAAHPGLDIDGETGDPIWAAARGTVAWAGAAPAGYSGYGLMVLIDHGEGVQTLYAHLSVVGATVGQVVEAGDLIGAMGTTGRVTGSHLHFEVRRHGVIGDPTTFLPPR